MKRIGFFTIFIIASIFILYFLYRNFSSNKDKDLYYAKGGFKRSLLAVNLSLVGEYELQKGYYSIAGISDKKLIIKDANKSQLTVFNSDHTKELISLPRTIIPENIFAISINPLNEKIIDIQCNNDSKIFEFNIETQKVESTFNFGGYFDKAIRLTSNTFYAFVQSEKMNQYTLELFQFGRDGTGHAVKKSTLTKDAMNEDGTFRKSGNALLYVNFYNNSCVKIDTNLTTLTHFKSIDTTTALPKYINIKNNTISKYIQQPRPVNQLVRAFGHYLYIDSYVKANNDADNDPEQNSETIDVYDINNKCKYIGTMYFIKQDGKRLQDFIVHDNKLILQYPNKTLIYEYSL